MLACSRCTHLDAKSSRKSLGTLLSHAREGGAHRFQLYISDVSTTSESDAESRSKADALTPAAAAVPQPLPHPPGRSSTGSMRTTLLTPRLRPQAVTVRVLCRARIARTGTGDKRPGFCDRRSDRRPIGQGRRAPSMARWRRGAEAAARSPSGKWDPARSRDVSAARSLLPQREDRGRPDSRFPCVSAIHACSKPRALGLRAHKLGRHPRGSGRRCLLTCRLIRVGVRISANQPFLS